ncbi:MAG: hypothetical protein H7320_13785 [Ferruginibacter sp.]|nr:hypothetical protein [Ferruginibacter sp.]
MGHTDALEALDTLNTYAEEWEDEKERLQDEIFSLQNTIDVKKGRISSLQFELDNQPDIEETPTRFGPIMIYADNLALQEHIENFLKTLQ